MVKRTCKRFKTKKGKRCPKCCSAEPKKCQWIKGTGCSDINNPKKEYPNKKVTGGYNIYIICKSEEDFVEKSRKIMSQYKDIICHIQWIPGEYLTLTQCNRKLLKDLQTRHNTQQKKIIAKLGTIAAHRKALLSIYSSKTNNNLILEADAVLSKKLPNPPSKTCYMGGWIIPPQITQAGKINMRKIVKPKNGMNEIEYDKFSILMAHAYFIKTYEESLDIFHSTLTEKIKNYDVHLIQERLIHAYYYPPIFVQKKHISEIDMVQNINDKRTYDYGLQLVN